jgi:hypothetical protein
MLYYVSQLVGINTKLKYFIINNFLKQTGKEPNVTSVFHCQAVTMAPAPMPLNVTARMDGREPIVTLVT